MSGKKLCFIISHSHAGGAERLWLDLADGLAARGHTSTLFALYPGGKGDTAIELRWNHIIHSKPRDPARMLKLVGGMASLFREHRFDYVLSALPAANALAPLAIKLAGVETRSVRSNHSPASTHNRLIDAIDGLVGGWNNVRATVSVSNTVKRSFDSKSEAYRQKSIVIPNALSEEIERELAALDVERTAAKNRTVVATGRLAAQKNYPVLIRATRRVPEMQVRIVGSGPDESLLREQVRKLAVEDRVEFAGLRPRKEALALLATGDIFVQPSLFEGHSLALIEAGKLGLPLVVSNVPVQVEAITDEDGELCGIAVDPHDDAALAHGISMLLNEPDIYRHYSQRSRNLVRNLTFENMVDAYERLIAD